MLLASLPDRLSVRPERPDAGRRWACPGRFRPAISHLPTQTAHRPR